MRTTTIDQEVRDLRAEVATLRTAIEDMLGADGVDPVAELAERTAKLETFVVAVGGASETINPPRA